MVRVELLHVPFSVPVRRLVPSSQNLYDKCQASWSNLQPSHGLATQPTNLWLVMLLKRCQLREDSEWLATRSRPDCSRRRCLAWLAANVSSSAGRKPCDASAPISQVHWCQCLLILKCVLLVRPHDIKEQIICLGDRLHAQGRLVFLVDSLGYRIRMHMEDRRAKRRCLADCWQRTRRHAFCGASPRTHEAAKNSPEVMEWTGEFEMSGK